MNDVERHILEFVAPGSRVIDLGCGKGELLKALSQTKQVKGLGIEIDKDCILECLKSGVSVIQMDIDKGLSEFQDNQFDLAIVKQTIQALRHPKQVFDEMLRIARECIIVFPNFAHWNNRLRLLLTGKMPVSAQLPYEWYDTPNIHLMSVKDFEALCQREGVTLKTKVEMGDSWFSQQLIALGLGNLGSSLVLVHLQKKTH